jgi:predicted benzoate:H+ symporter BenE
MLAAMRPSLRDFSLSAATAGFVAVLVGFTLPEAVGAFLMCAALITLFGITGWFERLMDRLPIAIASALLAGVLARFGLDAFVALKDDAHREPALITFLVTSGRLTLAGIGSAFWGVGAIAFFVQQWRPVKTAA